jgi:hypothetical protein
VWLNKKKLVMEPLLPWITTFLVCITSYAFWYCITEAPYDYFIINKEDHAFIKKAEPTLYRRHKKTLRWQEQKATVKILFGKKGRCYHMQIIRYWVSVPPGTVRVIKEPGQNTKR